MNDKTIYFSSGASSLGTMLVATTVDGVCAIFLGDDCSLLTAELKRRFATSDIRLDHDGLRALRDDTLLLIETPSHPWSYALDMRGTPFQRQVWTVLRDIPLGQTASYTEIAERIGNPRAIRAVANACAANHLAIVVPCHRVVKASGDISGYRWGIGRKEELLRRERR